LFDLDPGLKSADGWPGAGYRNFGRGMSGGGSGKYLPTSLHASLNKRANGYY